MLRQHSSLARNLLAGGDLLVTFLAFWMAYVIRRSLGEGFANYAPSRETLTMLVGVAIVSQWVLYRGLGLYRSRRVLPVYKEAFGILFANGLTLLLLLATVAGLQLEQASRLQLAIFMALESLLVLAVHLGGRAYLRKQRRDGANTRNLSLLATSAAHLESMRIKVRENEAWGFRFTAVVLDADEAEFEKITQSPLINRFGDRVGVARLTDAEQTLDDEEIVIDEVWIDGFPSEGSGARRFAEAAAERGKSVRYVLSEHHTPGSRWGYELVSGMETLTATVTPVDELALTAKRAIDFFGSLFLILAAMPAFLIVSLLILLEGKGPVLFSQERVGLNGRKFTLFKFRSMVPGADALKKELMEKNEMSGPVFKMTNDPRVTKLGGWLRKTSLDELPQLFNVLAGHMSLVGPRPPLASEVNLYSPDQRRRLSVKPGITGLWQVLGRNEISDFQDWVKLDLEYIDSWSLWLDLEILLKTVPAVLASRGAK